MNGSLEPRTFGEIFNHAFNVYGKNFLRLGAIATVAAVLAGAFQLWGLLWVMSRMGGFTGSIGAGALEYLLSASIFFVVYLVVSSLVDGALVYAISEQYFQQPISFVRAYRFAGGRAGSLIGSSLLVMLVVVILSVTIIGLPFAVYLAVKWSLVRQTVLIEGCAPGAALSRSSELVKGNWWRVLGILLLVGLIAGGINGISGMVPVLGSVIGLLVSIPITAAVTTILYYDLRVRKEGYNFETLARELHPAGGNGAAG